MFVEGTRICKLLQSESDFLIYTHIKPDGDAIGSAYGLAVALQSIGKKVKVRISEPVPSSFSTWVNQFTSDDVETGIGIALDISAASRLGTYKNEDISICIDHHRGNKGLIQHTYLEDDSVSCSAIVFRLLRQMDIDIPQLAFDLLFAGHVADSDCFQSADINSKAFTDAASMIENGANAADIIKQVYSNKSQLVLECEREMLSSIEYFFDGKVAICLLPQAKLEHIGKSNTRTISEIPRKVDGVEMGISVFQISNEEYALSFRSNGRWDASLIATRFGGGGHFSSSGATLIAPSYFEAVEKIVDEIKKIYLLNK